MRRGCYYDRVHADGGERAAVTLLLFAVLSGCGSVGTPGLAAATPTATHGRALRDVGARAGHVGELALDGPPLLTGMKAHKQHNGCAIETDDEGRIWMTMGDANTARGLNLSQDPNGLNGRALRINRDGSIPDDNPILEGAGGRTASYDLGHRNPHGSPSATTG